MNLIDPKKVLDKMESVVEKKNYLNRIKIIRQLYADGDSTATNIGQVIGISLPTVNLLLNDLLEENWVVKQGRGESQGGRKPDLYGLADDAFFVLAIELNKFSAKAALYNSKNQKVSAVRHAKIHLDNDPATVNKVYEFGSQAITESGIPAGKIIAVGITMPGLVDSVAGINHTHLNPGKSTLRATLEKKFGRKVYLENDARAMTLAEFKSEHKETHKNVLGIFVDWGIGLGIVIDQKLYRGYSGFAGEFSHLPLFNSGDISCSCGKRGCLETVASGTTLVRMANEAIKANPDTILAQMAKEREGDLGPHWVVDAALAGDQQAIGILSEVGQNLGKGIAMLIQLFNPELIILRGPVAEARNFILIPIQQALNIYSMAKLSEKTQIKFSSLGKEVGLQGTFSVVNEHIFEDVLN